MIKRDTSFIGRARDTIAWTLAQFAFERVATPWYQAMIGGSIRLGLETAAKDEEPIPLSQILAAQKVLEDHTRGYVSQVSVEAALEAARKAK